jgi:2-keto-4-pentenoate hydratase/2-oxohepta-3-ene-1,7-dioic acid hydratase in catechol pathway
MKLVTFNAGKEPRLGVVAGDQVVDLAAASDRRLPADMLSFLALGEAGIEEAKMSLEEGLRTRQSRPLNSVKLMAPVLNPSKVIAIGLNYMDHCREQKIEPPKAPVIFTKFPSSIVGQGDTIRWDPGLTQQVDYEAELAVVMGRTARRVSQAEALNYVAGYTILNDVSARELQFGDGQWIRGKSLDTFCPLGPYLVTRDEIPNPNNLVIRCIVNDQVLQDSTTAEMIFQVPFLIEYITRAFTLYPGDVITTGTPDGVGVFRNPKVFLKDGDMVTVEIEGLGQLTNPCAEESLA